MQRTFWQYQESVKTSCLGYLQRWGDISRFDNVKEIQKLSGLGLVACSSGKHTGETKISHRGRKRLRYWLFQAAKSAVAHSEEFKELHVYYTTRKQNPLKEDAVAHSDCLQDTEGDFYNPDKRDSI